MDMNERHDISPSTALLNDAIASGKVCLMRLDRALEQIGLSSDKFWVLQAVAISSEEVTVTHLAECMGTVKSNVTPMLDPLEKDDLIRRNRSTEDRRLVHIEITGYGKAQYERGRHIFDDVNQSLQSAFSTAELQTFQAFLKRLILTRRQ